MASSRPFDVIVWGATGFVGENVCEEIAKDYHGSLRWAMAGRNRLKLEQVRTNVAKINKDVENVPILVGNVYQQASLDEVAAQTRVLINLVGPYAWYGTPVVEACLKARTHYCDLTGEIQWVREIICRYHDEAVQKGVKIVTCCGYESAVPDMGVYFVTKKMLQHYGKRTARVTSVTQSNSGLLQSFSQGGLSGGSWYSFINMFKETPAKELGAILNPYCMCSNSGGDTVDWWFPGFNTKLRQWTYPTILKLPNRRVVHRANQLAGTYGRDFRYADVIGTQSLVLCLLGTLFVQIVNIMLFIPLLHPILKLFVNRQGQGPSRVIQLEGEYKHIFVAESEEEAGGTPTVLYGVMGDARDPGYWGTSRLILEAGICLAALSNGNGDGDGDDVPSDDLPQMHHGGVLTPSTAMGDAYVARLKAAGVTITWRPEVGESALKFRSDSST